MYYYLLVVSQNAGHFQVGLSWECCFEGGHRRASLLGRHPSSAQHWDPLGYGLSIKQEKIIQAVVCWKGQVSKAMAFISGRVTWWTNSIRFFRTFSIEFLEHGRPRKMYLRKLPFSWSKKLVSCMETAETISRPTALQHAQVSMASEGCHVKMQWVEWLDRSYKMPRMSGLK